MKSSVFQTLGTYLMNVIRGLKSVWSSLMTACPYLFSWNSNELKKEVTEQYPDPVSSRTVDDLPPRTRGFLFNDIDRCTGCRACEVVCPVKCIAVETEPGPDETKLWVSVYDIDFGRCTFCGLCVEACLPGSLNHTRQFEGAVYSLSDLVKGFGRGRVSPEQRMKWDRKRQLEQSEVMK